MERISRFAMAATIICGVLGVVCVTSSIVGFALPAFPSMFVQSVCNVLFIVLFAMILDRSVSRARTSVPVVMGIVASSLALTSIAFRNLALFCEFDFDLEDIIVVVSSYSLDNIEIEYEGVIPLFICVFFSYAASVLTIMSMFWMSQHFRRGSMQMVVCYCFAGWLLFMMIHNMASGFIYNTSFGHLFNILNNLSVYSLYALFFFMFTMHDDVFETAMQTPRPMP